MIRCLKQLARKIIVLNPTKANYKFVLKDWISLGDLSAMSKVLETKRFSQNLDPVIMNGPEARRVLVLAPHPDDDVISSGGTILHLIRNGCYVKVIYLTSGTRSPYSNERNNVMPVEAEVREQEAFTVASRIGMDIEFWRNDSKNFKINNETVNRLRKACSEVKPDCMFVPFLADDNDDHRRSIHLFYEAFKDFGRLNFEIWAYQVYSTILPNVAVDITDVIGEKLKLVEIYRSQKRSRDWAHYIKGLNAFNCRFLKTNEPRYAELFFVVPADEYLRLCRLYFQNPASNIYYSDSYK